MELDRFHTVAQRLGARHESPEDLHDRLIRDEWISRVADSWWRGFFAGGTVFGVIAFVGWLILEGWK